MIKEELSKAIAEGRTKLIGKTHVQVADEIGINPSHMWKIQSGGTRPRIDIAESILNYLGYELKIVKRK